MRALLESILGANWRTTLTGFGGGLSMLLGFLAVAPYELGPVAEIIPPAWKAKLLAASAIAGFILKSWNAALQKDKDVTGGSVQQPDPISKRYVPAIAALLIPALLLTGCGTMTPLRQAQWRATGEFVAQRAMTVAGRVILNSAIATLSNRDADFLDSAAVGLRSEMGNIVTADDVARVVQIWTPDDPQWAHLAAQLADTFTEAQRSNPAPATVEALAVGLNRAAAGDRVP